MKTYPLQIRWTYARDFLDLAPINWFVTTLTPSIISIIAIIYKSAGAGAVTLRFNPFDAAIAAVTIAMLWCASRAFFWLLMPELFKNHRTREKYLEERQKAHPSPESWPQVYLQDVLDWNEQNTKFTRGGSFALTLALVALFASATTFLALLLSLR